MESLAESFLEFGVDGFEVLFKMRTAGSEIQDQHGLRNDLAVIGFEIEQRETPFALRGIGQQVRQVFGEARLPGTQFIGHGKQPSLHEDAPRLDQPFIGEHAGGFGVLQDGVGRPAGVDPGGGGQPIRQRLGADGQRCGE